MSWRTESSADLGYWQRPAHPEFRCSWCSIFRSEGVVPPNHKTVNCAKLMLLLSSLLSQLLVSGIYA
jgi:hypothetical protein